MQKEWFFYSFIFMHAIKNTSNLKQMRIYSTFALEVDYLQQQKSIFKYKLLYLFNVRQYSNQQ